MKVERTRVGQGGHTRTFALLQWAALSSMQDRAQQQMDDPAHPDRLVMACSLIAPAPSQLQLHVQCKCDALARRVSREDRPARVCADTLPYARNSIR